MNIEQLRKEIEADEGRRNDQYLCSEGHRTVGIGHLVTLKDPEYYDEIGDRITDERVNELFEQDIQVTIADCRIIFNNFDGMPEEAQHVFANMCFQLGRPRLSKFKRSIQLANDGHWLDCSDEILDSRWAKQTPKRAERLSVRLAALGVPS